MKPRIEIIRLWPIALAAFPLCLSSASDFGSIRVGQDLTLTVRRSIGPTEAPVTLTPGPYELESWIIRRRDAEGVLWTCQGLVPVDKRPFEVVVGREIELPLGEPVESVLTAQRRGSQFTFSHRLQGRLAETVRIEKDGKRSPAPTLWIRNAERSYEKALTFDYG